MLSRVALFSGLYDVVAGAFLLLAPTDFAAIAGLPPPSPRIFSDLNAVFLLAVGVGYLLAWRDPVRYRGYMWVMGPFLKGAGAVAFVVSYMSGAAPASVLLFAASDALLAAVTLLALLQRPPHQVAN